MGQGGYGDGAFNDSHSRDYCSGTRDSVSGVPFVQQ